MVRAGRITWRGLGLRAQLPPWKKAAKHAGASPDPMFSRFRNTSVAEYVDPIVHEIKVHRSDLARRPQTPEKRAAYLDLGGECWYVLGCDAKGRAIGAADEVPAECGVMVLENNRLVVARAAPRRRLQSLPFCVWLALAKATPVAGLTEDDQRLLRRRLRTGKSASAWTAPQHVDATGQQPRENTPPTCRCDDNLGGARGL